MEWTPDWESKVDSGQLRSESPNDKLSECDERMSSVLQNLLVSVERGIERLEWDQLSSNRHSWSCGHGHRGSGRRTSVQMVVDVRDSAVQTSPVEEYDDRLPNAEHALTENSSKENHLVVVNSADVTKSDAEVKVPNLCPNSPLAAAAVVMAAAATSTHETDSKVQRNDSVDSGMEPSYRKLSLTLNIPAELVAGIASESQEEDIIKYNEDDDEDEPDDGYHDNTLSQPTTLSQLDQDLLHSGVLLLPGCRDNEGRSLLVLFADELRDRSVPATHLAELLMYFCSVPKTEVSKRGVLLLVVLKVIPASHIHFEPPWDVIDEAFCLLEANVPESVVSVLACVPEKVKKPFPNSRVKCDYVDDHRQFLTCIRRDQLLPELGGTYAYDHQEWLSFRKFLEPFVNGCRLSGRRLVSVMQELRVGRLPPSAALTGQLIEQQKRHIHKTYQDEQLRHLEEEGDTILKELEVYGKRAPHNQDYRDALERSTALYSELRRAMSRLSKLAEKRLAKLEECLHLKTLAEESSQVLSWLCRRGEESLTKHQKLADSLQGIKEQEEEFEKFYFVAMRQIEKGNDLLEEAALASPLAPSPHEPGSSQSSEPPPMNKSEGVQEVTSSLKQHLYSFSERLEDTRERLEDTAKCYHLLDKVYEWALDTMRFVSKMKLETSSKMEELLRLIRTLDDYLDEHPPIVDEVFQEMIEISSRLENTRLVEQCQTARSRCIETVELVQARQATLIKARQQLEFESFRLPSSQDCSDQAPSIRSQRSHSHPQNFWPQSVSTPCHYGSPSSPGSSYSGAQSYVRRRSMSSITPPAGFSSPFASYTAFPSNAYPVSSLKNTIQLENYLREKEEQLQSHGLITEDLTTQGPVASISRCVVDSRCSGNFSQDSAHPANSNQNSGQARSSAGSRLATKGSPPTTTSSSSLHPVSQRPVKKHMRICPTWQLCEEALQKAADQVRQQNERLRQEKLLEEASTHSGSESGGSLPDQDDVSEISSFRPLTSTSGARSDGSSSMGGPGPVNSHLQCRTSTEELAAADGTTSETDTVKTTCVDDQVRAKTTLMLIMRELIQTERDYVKSLEYTIENYLPELLREDIPQALRGQRNVIFGNIEKIFEFHSQYFLHELERCENAPFLVGQYFLQYERQFYLYALYNKNKPKSDTLMSEYGTSFFRRKQLELKDKMDLASYLLKPVQRMGKYALLLKQLLKECPEVEKEAEHSDLKAAEEMVRFQLRHGNDLLAMDALRDCDVNVKEQGRLLRQDEFLVWQGRYRKSLRRVFLFEDLILFSKGRRDPEQKGQEIYQYKQSIKTTDIGMTEQIGDSPTKFEIWFRKRKLHDIYILQAPTSEVKGSWAHEISRLLWKQALKNREIRLAEMSSMGIGNKPCLDIKPSEDQINDRSIRFNNRATRFRNSIAGCSTFDQLRSNNKRPHSIISVSSSSSSGSSSASFNINGALNLGFEPGDSPRSHYRSMTQQSQCSTESGFCTDTSLTFDHSLDSDVVVGVVVRHKKAERSDSVLSNDSVTTQPPSVSELSLNSSSDAAVPVTAVLPSTTEETLTTAM